jgi:hypothetical protein
VVITKASLKALTDQDYLAMQNNVGVGSKPTRNNGQVTNLPLQGSNTSAFKKTILPQIEAELNAGKNFANLRQIYNAVILASWFKNKFKESFFKYYLDRKNINGIALDDKASKEKIFNLYVEAFQKGTYSMIKTERDNLKVTKRTYFSGGFKPGMGLPQNGPVVVESVDEIAATIRGQVIDLRLGDITPEVEGKIHTIAEGLHGVLSGFYDESQGTVGPLHVNLDAAEITPDFGHHNIHLGINLSALTSLLAKEGFNPETIEQRKWIAQTAAALAKEAGLEDKDISVLQEVCLLMDLGRLAEDLDTENYTETKKIFKAKRLETTADALIDGARAGGFFQQDGKTPDMLAYAQSVIGDEWQNFMRWTIPALVAHETLTLQMIENQKYPASPVIYALIFAHHDFRALRLTGIEDSPEKIKLMLAVIRLSLISSFANGEYTSSLSGQDQFMRERIEKEKMGEIGEKALAAYKRLLGAKDGLLWNRIRTIREKGNKPLEREGDQAFLRSISIQELEYVTYNLRDFLSKSDEALIFFEADLRAAAQFIMQERQRYGNQNLAGKTVFLGRFIKGLTQDIPLDFNFGGLPVYAQAGDNVSKALEVVANYVHEDGSTGAGQLEQALTILEQSVNANYGTAIHEVQSQDWRGVVALLELLAKVDPVLMREGNQSIAFNTFYERIAVLVEKISANMPYQFKPGESKKVQEGLERLAMVLRGLAERYNEKYPINDSNVQAAAKSDWEAYLHYLNTIYPEMNPDYIDSVDIQRITADYKDSKVIIDALLLHEEFESWGKIYLLPSWRERITEPRLREIVDRYLQPAAHDPHLTPEYTAYREAYRKKIAAILNWMKDTTLSQDEQGYLRRRAQESSADVDELAVVYQFVAARLVEQSVIVDRKPMIELAIRVLKTYAKNQTEVDVSTLPIPAMPVIKAMIDQMVWDVQGLRTVMINLEGYLSGSGKSYNVWQIGALTLRIYQAQQNTPREKINEATVYAADIILNCPRIRVNFNMGGIAAHRGKGKGVGGVAWQSVDVATKGSGKFYFTRIPNQAEIKKVFDKVNFAVVVLNETQSLREFAGLSK